MSTVLLVLAFILGALIAVFSVLNLAAVPVNFFGYMTQVPVALVIFISAFVGAVLVFFLYLRERFEHGRDMRSRDKRIRELEAQASMGRSAPSSAPRPPRSEQTTSPMDRPSGTPPRQ